MSIKTYLLSSFILIYFFVIFLTSNCSLHAANVDIGPEDEKSKSIQQKVEIPQTSKDILADTKMVLVRGGIFNMGDTFGDGHNDEKPVHEVNLDDFYIGATEVTQAQWVKIMGSNHSHFNNCVNCPAGNVSWNDVQEFLKRLNSITGMEYRLPTEAEWEYAARSGGKNEKWASTNSKAELSGCAWYNVNSGRKAHPVGTKNPNRLGIYDMSGNVWEWCSDFYGKNYYVKSAQKNPKGPSSGVFHVLRGGSWKFASVNLRTSDRSLNPPNSKYNDTGFRIARSP